MFNPLHPFETRFIEAFRRKGVKAFVRQTYKRGSASADGSGSFVLIHFERELAAQQYYDVIKHDPNRALLWTGNADDLAVIRELTEKAQVYTMLKIRDAEYKARLLLDKRIRAFIEYKLHWRPGREEGVSFSLDVQFGEIYARLRCRSKEIKVKLEEIENARYVL
jgi:hypothetical protein